MYGFVVERIAILVLVWNLLRWYIIYRFRKDGCGSGHVDIGIVYFNAPLLYAEIEDWYEKDDLKLLEHDWDTFLINIK